MKYHKDAFNEFIVDLYRYDASKRDEKKFREEAYQQWKGLSEEERDRFIQIALSKIDLLGDSPECNGVKLLNAPLPDKMLELNWFLKRDQLNFVYCIVSTNVFLHNERNCIPAEVGITLFSFKDGIIESYHSLIDPNSDPMGIPILEVPNVVENTAEDHKIPHRDMDFPKIESILPKIYSLIHRIGDGATKFAFLFVESDEKFQTEEVFKWFKKQSERLGYGLTWNVHIACLDTLFAFLNACLPQEKKLRVDPYEAFKSAIYDWSDLCAFHDEEECRRCAISRAFIYTYIVSEHFSKMFGCEPLRQVKDKFGNGYYMPNFV